MRARRPLHRVLAIAALAAATLLFLAGTGASAGGCAQKNTGEQARARPEDPRAAIAFEPGAEVWPKLVAVYVGVARKSPRGRMPYALAFDAAPGSVDFHATTPTPPTQTSMPDNAKLTLDFHRAGRESTLTFHGTHDSGKAMSERLVASDDSTPTKLVFCASARAVDAGVGCEAMEVRFEGARASDHLRVVTRIRGKVHTDISLDPAGSDAGAAAIASLANFPSPKFSSWTDDAGVAALALDCHDGDDPDPSGGQSSLSCTVPFEQSCVYDPCFEKASDCHRACGKTCGVCDDACVSTCSQCAKPCADDACRRACAVTTGACKEECLKTHDRCASGTCGEAAIACETIEKSRWKKAHCACSKIFPCTSRCEHVQHACEIKCTNASPPECFDRCTTAWDACRDRCAKESPGCDITYCTFGADMPGPE